MPDFGTSAVSHGSGPHVRAEPVTKAGQLGLCPQASVFRGHKKKKTLVSCWGIGEKKQWGTFKLLALDTKIANDGSTSCFERSLNML